MWVILDFEASSLDKFHSYPIQVGFYEPKQDVIYSRYIRPIESWNDWSEVSEKIHNIPREKIEAEGSCPLEICKNLNFLLSERNVYCDGGYYDQHWLNRLYSAAGEIQGRPLSPTFNLKCVFDLLFTEEFSSDAKNYYNQKRNSAKHLNVKEHDAGCDAYIIHDALKQIWLKQNYG